MKSLSWRMQGCLVALVLGAMTHAQEYEIELVETPLLVPVKVQHNDAEDYAYTIQSSGTFFTRAVIGSVRYSLPGFLVTGMNSSGAMCGVLGETQLGVTWKPGSGYTYLRGIDNIAAPMYMDDSGAVGGATSIEYIACIWREGVPQPLPVNGFVAAMHPNGMVAGHRGDPTHGYQSWTAQNGKPVATQPGFYVERIDSRGRVIGGTNQAAFGSAIVYTAKGPAYLPGSGNTWVVDMNDSGTGVGMVGGYYWENSFPVVWRETSRFNFVVHNLANLVDLTGWTNVYLYDITNTGVILATGRKDGIRWIMRIRPAM